MKKEIDIHNYPRRLESSIRRLKNSEISDRNKQLILEFRDYASLEQLSIARIERYMQILKQWAEILNKDFDHATKEDMIKSVREVQENPKYSAWTKSTFKSMLKRFYKWLKQTDDKYPPEVDWIKTEIKRTDRKMLTSNDMITEDECKRMIKAANHPRDKAFIALLSESGCRIGELGSLQLKNIEFDTHGVLIHVDGKTGQRPVRLIWSVPFLTSWLNIHPLKEDKESPVWLTLQGRNTNKLMQYQTMRKLIRTLLEKAKINKKVKPHLFRHSRATFLANHLTEFQMNQYLGWVQGSNMPSTYIHMSGKRVDSAILGLNGIQQEQKAQEITTKPKTCPRCQTVNSFENTYCFKCSGLLDVETAIQIQNKVAVEQKERQSADNVMDLLMKDPEFREMLQEKMRALGIGKAGL